MFYGIILREYNWIADFKIIFLLIKKTLEKIYMGIKIKYTWVGIHRFVTSQLC